MARLAIRMPKMSMTMTEGEVSSWFVKVGDAVAEGDVVCEVMTDKVDMEVESSVSGTLVEIVVESGLVDVGVPIGWVEGEDTGGGFGDLLEAPEPADAADAPAAETPASTDPPAAEAPATTDPPAAEAPATTDPPAAEAPATTDPPAAETPATTDPPAAETPATTDPPAAEAPATTVPVEESVPESPEPVGGQAPVDRPPAGPVAAVPRARGLATERGIDLSTVTGSGPDGLVRVEDVEAFAGTGKPARTATDRRTAVRVAVARKMTPTALIPQFTVWREVRLDAAESQRQGLSWTTVLLRAYAGALREIPELLARWEDDRPVECGEPAIALAVATDRGLLVPTFLEPDLGAAKDVDAEVRAVVKAARSGKLDPAYMGIANGSLSNLGGMGVDRFQALLTPPQASVLALGSIRQRPVAVTGGVGLALTVEAGLTVDHRVADGAHAAELLDRFAERLLGQ